jgi:hypothetical protein
MVSVLDLSTDLNDDTLSLTTVTQGEHGSVAIQSGAVTYAPDSAFAGDDSFTYTIEDQFGNEATGTISVTVTEPQAPPTSVWTAQNTAVTISVPDLAFDPAGQTLTTTAVTQGSRGSVVINQDGSVTYTPDSTFTGDDHFDYTVEDPDGHSATQTITVTVGVAGPVALDDDVTTEVNTAVNVAVLDDALDPAGCAVTVTAVTQGAHGTVVIETDGTVTYTPANGYEGPDSFTYTVEDGSSNPATGTINVTVGTATSPISAILEDLTEIQNELNDYDETTSEAISGQLPAVISQIDDQLSSLSTFLSNVSIETHGTNGSYQVLVSMFFNDFIQLKQKLAELETTRTALFNTLSANKQVIDSLNLSLNNAKSAPNPDINLINTLQAAVNNLMAVQTTGATKYLSMSTLAFATWLEARDMRNADRIAVWGLGIPFSQIPSLPPRPAAPDIESIIPWK